MSREEVILNADEIDLILTRMSEKIVERHNHIDNLVLIGIRTGGVYLADRIQKKILSRKGKEILRGDLDINLYRDDWTRIGYQPVVRKTEMPFSLEDKDVVLIDDVLFTGRTVRAAMDAIIDFGRPDRIELAVLVDRGHRELPIEANYVGKYVKTSRDMMVNVYFKETVGRDEVVIIR